MSIFGAEVPRPYKAPYVIAEISCNHEGSIDSAFAHIREAKLAGASAVKIQAYTPEEMTVDSHHPSLTCNVKPWAGVHLRDLYNKTQTPLDWIPGLFNYAKEIGIPIFSSVFGLKSLEALERVGCQTYKIASFEITDLELIKAVASTKKRMIISTGCASHPEIEEALNYSVPNTVLMHCISKYPTEHQVSELLRIKDLIRINGYPIGFSDHTTDYKSAIMAYAMGVSIFEKHMSLSHTSEDAKFSTNKYTFKMYIDALRDAAEAAQTRPDKYNNIFKRSLWVTQDISKGENFSPNNVQALRPNSGIHSNNYERIVSGTKKAKRKIEAGTPLTMDMIE